MLDSLRRRANARNVSFRISLRWPIHIINPVDKTKLSIFSQSTLLICITIKSSMYVIRWPGRDIDSFFYPRLLFFIREFFFLSATFFSSTLFLSIRDFCFACVKTAGSLTLNRAGLRAGNMAAAMAGEDREEEKQGAIRKVNMLSYLWY